MDHFKSAAVNQKEQQVYFCACGQLVLILLDIKLSLVFILQSLLHLRRVFIYSWKLSPGCLLQKLLHNTGVLPCLFCSLIILLINHGYYHSK